MCTDNFLQKIFVVGLCVFLLLPPWGCAKKIPSELRAQLGIIGVVPGPYVLETAFEGSASGFIAFQRWVSGVGEGIKSGAKFGVTTGWNLTFFMAEHPLGGEAGHPANIMLLLAVALVGTTVGPVAGGIGGILWGALSHEDAKLTSNLTHLQQQLDVYLKNLSLQEKLGQQVVVVAEQTTAHQIIELKERDGEEIKKKITEQNVNSLLEVNITSLGIKGTSAVAPEFSLFLTGKADLRRASDSLLLYRDNTFRFVSKPLLLEEWTAENGLVFEKALIEGYQNLAKQIVAKFL